MSDVIHEWETPERHNITGEIRKVQSAWRLSCDCEIKLTAIVKEHPDGEWVKHDDYVLLAERNRKLEAVAKAAKAIRIALDAQTVSTGMIPSIEILMGSSLAFNLTQALKELDAETPDK